MRHIVECVQGNKIYAAINIFNFHRELLFLKYGVELLIIRIIYIYILKALVLFVRVKLLIYEIISMVRKQTFCLQKLLVSACKNRRYREKVYLRCYIRC